jgi:hypothetical protein
MQIVFNTQTIATIVLLAEALIIFGLLCGWYFGARRLNFQVHHGFVYTAVLIHSITVFVWMLPASQWAISSGILLNFAATWRLSLHFIFGAIADILGMMLAVTFVIKRDMPLALLKRARPIMITTLLLWILTFATGILNFLFKYGFIS